MALPLYPPFVMAQDLAPAQGFGSEIDEACEEIHAATKGWGANKQKVIDALATKDSTERAKLAIRYKELHNVQLSELMKKEFSGHFGLALKFLALPPNEAEAAMLRNATAKIGASVNIVWSVLVGRTNEEIELLKKTYFKKYDKDMSKMLAHELTGNMERLIFNCIQGGAEEYNPQFHTKEKAIEDAEAIYSKGQGRWVGTEERGIFKILCAAPPEYLREIDHAYSEKYGYTLLKALHKEMGGHMGEACEHLVAMKLKPFEAIATLFKTSCAGFGTDELLLTCCVIRYQGVMAQVMAAHIELYGMSIHDRVRAQVSGKLQQLLLQVLNAVWPEEV